MVVWEAVGWVGTAIYVLAYILLALRVLPAERAYFLANLVAAVCVAAVSVAKDSPQAVAINALWAVASLYALCGRMPPLLGLRPIHARVVVAGLVGAGLIAMPAMGIPFGASLLGWGSVVGFTAGYILFVSQKIVSLEFHIFNLVAATAILPALILAANWPVVVLEAVWAAAALAGIVSDAVAARRRPIERSTPKP
jgi:hypothetical protein